MLFVRNNEIESYIWNQIDGNTSIDEIVNQIFCDMKIQGASFDKIKKDVNDCVYLLANRNERRKSNEGR